MLKILMVDGDEAFLRQARSFLEDEIEGFSLTTLTSAEEALDKIRHGIYDAIVSDFRLPKMDGLNFLEIIRDEIDSDIPFIYLISRDGEEFAVKALNLGANRYLRKAGPKDKVFKTLAEKVKHEVERYQNMKELERSKESFKNIFENATVGIYRTTPEGRILEVNPELLKILGYSSFEELAERDLEEEGYEPEYPRSKFKEKIEKEGRVKGLESAWRRKDGSAVFVRESARVVRDEDGEPLYYEGVVEDITDRIEAEERIKHLNSFLRSTRNVNQIIVQGEDIEEIMQGACESLMDVKNFLGASIALIDESTDMIHPLTECGIPEFSGDWKLDVDGKGEAPECIIKVVRSKKIQIYEPKECNECSFRKSKDCEKCLFIPMKRDERLIGVLIVSSEYTDGESQEEIELLQEVANDLAYAWEKRKAEEKLKESEDKYKSLFYGTPLGTFYYDKTGVVKECNEKFVEIIGSSKEELIGLDMLNELEDEEMLKAVKYSLEEGESSYEGYYTSVTAGKTTPIRALFKGLRDEEGEIYAGIALVEDITERKEAEEKIRESERKHRRLYETMTQGVVYQDADGRLIRANPAAERILGISVDEMKKRTSESPEWRPLDENGEPLPGKDHPSMKALHTGKSVKNEVMGVYNPEKEEYRWIKIDAIPLREPGDEKPSRVYAIFSDITERKEAEEEWESIFEAIGHPTIIMDKEHNILEANKTVLEKVDMSIEELRQKKCYDIFHGTEAPPENCPYEKLMKTRDVEVTDMEIELFGGHYLVSVTPVFDIDGELEKVIHIATDITKRKEIEDALKESQERLDLATTVTNDGIWDWNIPSGEVYFDKTYYLMAGYEPDEFPHRLEEFQKRVHPEYIDYVMDQAHKHFEGEIEKFDVEFRFKRKDGGWMWIKGKGQIVERSENGEPLRFVGTHTDITERKEAERIKEFVNFSLDRANIEVFWITPEGEFIYTNETAIERLGYSREELENMHVWDIDPEPEYTQEKREERWEKLKEEGVLNFESHHETKDGYVYPVQITSNYMEYEGEEYEFAYAKDITERKEAEEELKRYQNHLEDLVDKRTLELQEKNEELESFAYSVSHDLRAPLRAIQGFGSILMEEKMPDLDEESRELIEKMANSAERMDKLIKDLLDYSRLSQAEIDLRYCALDRTIKKILDQLEGEIEEKDADIEVEDPIHPVMASNTVLDQVVLNLISNALKFVPEDRDPEVKIWTELTGDKVKLFIKDNGIGIDESERENIFKMFNRLHGVENFAGTGVGLAIVKKGIDKLGGYYGFESTPGEGSTFWIELDRARES